MHLRHILGAAIVITIIAAALAQPVAAGTKVQPPPQTGWTHAPKYQDDTPEFHGLALSGKNITFGSPVIVDLDGNSTNGREVVVGGSDGRVYALSSSGAVLWERNVPAGCSTNTTLIYSKPTVGAVFGGSALYVAVGYGQRGEAPDCDGGVVLYRGLDGQQTWNFSLKEQDAVTLEEAENLHSVITSVAMADVDGNGTLELAFGGLDRSLYLLNADKSLRWYYNAADSIWSTPLFMNVDGDAQLELVAGTDIRGNTSFNPPLTSGGYVYAFDTAPRSPARIPFLSGYLWQTPFDQVIYSSPLAAELLPSNPGLEIAVGSGCFWPENSTAKNGAWVKILRPSDGAVLQTLNAPSCTQSSPAAGDIDDDGQNEIVIITTGTNNTNDGRTRIVAWDPTNPTPIWQKIPYDPNMAPGDASGHDGNSDMQSPVIADLDGNGSLEVLAANHWSVHVLNGKTGDFLTCQSNTCGNQMSLYAWGTVKATPAVGHLDNDGDLEVVYGGMHVFNNTHGHMYAWTNFAGLLNSPAGAQEPYSMPWPEFRRTATANGILVPSGLAVSVDGLRTLVKTEQTRTYQIVIDSADGAPITPSATVVTDPSGIATVSVSGRTLTVTVSSTGLGKGTYSATIKIEAGDLPAVSIPLSLVVVDDPTTVNLPLIIR